MHMYVCMYVCMYRIAGFFDGENFHEFHELIVIHENLPSKYFHCQIMFQSIIVAIMGKSKG